MDDLNKQQMILLTLLVSFVTSIATGITTVSLVSQGETPNVTQTINRVVEKTIEKVVPVEQDPITIVKTPEKEVVTVVVKEEDLTIDSVNTNSQSLVRIYQSNRGGDRTFVALATVITGDGIVIANETFFSRNRNYIGVYAGVEYEMEAIYQSGTDPIIAMKPIVSEGANPTFTPIKMGDVSTAQLGQTVISLGGTENNTVNTGIINSLIPGPEGSVASIQTSIPGAQTLGAILINLKGEVLGMNIGQYQSGTFTPASTISKYIQKALGS